ncbi:DUF5713 family protein [Lysinibacillus sphaericus]|uniref:Uncharacterized protein n=1 Tax=Lysinibacillus sphaericus OT4b.31 TaxID=1285586 RepID=R7Z964_LYSSH|nr:DUF5713 family protein [Lysinibacillus sphaericus]EON70496.1 hypothetical protein H131_20667 [Lysinibacillus sphaericus OT4b.31]
MKIEINYLVDMYRDSYFPDFLVDKVKATIEGVANYLENEAYTKDTVQQKLDEMTDQLNELAEEFEENDSQIETVARESIADTVFLVLKAYHIDIDIEEAIRNRDW